MTETDINKFLSLFPESLMKLSVAEQHISILLYKLLAKGKPVSITQIVETSGHTTEYVRSTFDQWRSEVQWDENMHVVGFFGLSLSKTAHEFVVNGNTLYTWCAWDSFFIPTLLNQTAKVKSCCPVTKQEINLTISPDGIDHVSPTTAVVSLIAPDTDRISDDVVGTFCCHIHFFDSKDTGEGWANKNPETYIVTLQDTFLLGQHKNQKRYPNEILSVQ